MAPCQGPGLGGLPCCWEHPGWGSRIPAVGLWGLHRAGEEVEQAGFCPNHSLGLCSMASAPLVQARAMGQSSSKRLRQHSPAHDRQHGVAQPGLSRQG